MLPRRLVVTARRAYEVIDAERLVTKAIVVVRVLDGGSGGALGIATVDSERMHTRAHVASGGYIVVTGRPELALPGLTGGPQDVPLRIWPLKGNPVDLTITIPAGSPLPYLPAPLVVDPPPVALAGTVISTAFPYPALAGASVQLGGPPSPAPGYLALRIPLALEHAAGSDVRPRTLGPAAASTTTTAAVSAGDLRVLVTSLTGAVAGNVLQLGPDETAEHLVVTGTDAGAVLVQVPVARSRPSGAPVQLFPLTAAPAPPHPQLTRVAHARDGVILTSPAVSGALVELVDAVATRSELRFSDALTDTAGRWRIDGVRALPRVWLSVPAMPPLQAMPPTPYDVDYSADPNVLDLALSP
jgi:hypothetical protein